MTALSRRGSSISGTGGYGPGNLRLLESQGEVGFIESINRYGDSLVLCSVESKTCRELFHWNGGMQNWFPIPSDNAAPRADAGADIVAEATGPDGALVTLNGTGSTDPDGDELTYTWTDASGSVIATGATAHVIAPLGTSTYNLTVDDGRGGSSSDGVEVAVRDTTPPTITEVVAAPGFLWPPNHQMAPVTLAVTAMDLVDPSPRCTITGVASSEPESGLGDGDTAPDWVLSDGLMVNLRAERSGKGPGRIYSIQVACTDRYGLTARSTAVVTVAQSKAAR